MLKGIDILDGIVRDNQHKTQRTFLYVPETAWSVELKVSKQTEGSKAIKK